MPSNIDPFEPWRPRPDPDEARRHWRPREPEPERKPEPEWYRQPRAPEPIWTPRQEKPGNQAFVWWTIVLLVVALIVWGVNGASHISRVASALAVLWLALLLAWPVGRSWRWYARLGCLLAGLGAMVACWWWVPTTGGVAMGQAESALDRLRSLPPGDLAGYSASAPERNRVIEEFSRLRTDFKQAERKWYEGTVTQEINRADQERGHDAAAAQARLGRLAGSLLGSEHGSHFYPRIYQARHRALRSRLAQLGTQFEALTRKGQFALVARQARAARQELLGEAQQLNLEDELSQKVRAIRDKNLRQHLAAATVALDRLMRDRKYAEVARAGRRWEAELSAEARELNNEAQVTLLVRSRRQRAIEARIALARQDLDALVAAGKYEQVPKRAREHEEELKREASAVGVPAPGPGYLQPRRLALERRAEKGRLALEELLAKKEYAAVASRGAELLKELGPEARLVTDGTTWRETVVTVRRKALSARLEQARSEARELLVKESYQALGDTGEKAARELGPEALVVGLNKEVVRFRDLCRFCARLAKEAKADKKQTAEAENP